MNYGIDLFGIHWPVFLIAGVVLLGFLVGALMSNRRKRSRLINDPIENHVTVIRKSKK